jgi:hypothetical protein
MMANMTSGASSSTIAAASATTMPAAADDFPYGWAIGTPIVTIVVLLAILPLVFKLSSHWHAHVVRTRVPRPPDTEEAQAEATALPMPGQLRLLTLNMFLRPWPIADDSNDDYKKERLKDFCKQYVAS